MKDLYMEKVVTLSFGSNKCTNCGMCLNVCPRGVFERNFQKEISITDRDRCIECGACARNCPSGAVNVEPGVGCAYAIIKSKIFGGSPDCGCGKPANS